MCSCDITWYSIALHESNDQKNTVQLLIFIHECTSKYEIIEELLSMESLKDQTTGADIFEKKLIIAYQDIMYNGTKW